MTPTADQSAEKPKAMRPRSDAEGAEETAFVVDATQPTDGGEGPPGTDDPTEPKALR